MRSLLVIGVCLAIGFGFEGRQASAIDVRQVLSERCGGCHGKVNPQSGLNVLDAAALVENEYVKPRSLDGSMLWQRVSTNDADALMPPGDRLSDSELSAIRTWVEAGAPLADLTASTRPHITIESIYASVLKDLRNHPYEQQPRLRYFTIAHLHNNPTVADADLRLYRAALSKLVNSLSWEPRIWRPEPIDEHQTTFRIDLARIGWAKDNLWKRIIAEYPYGLSFDEVADGRLREDSTAVYAATGTRIPLIRADWFVARAAVPPLYHDLLQLPSGPGADRKLEEQLRVDVARDFQENLLVRAGFVKSNVSQHNRLVDRHESQFGAYWKSYDFGSSTGRGNLMQFPLGPKFDKNPHDRAAFIQDGGEIIFNLPNGLQAYLLIDGQGARIDRGPINVVRDSKQPLGNSEVINGISCMVCHVHGMQTFQDDVLQGHGLRGADALKVTRLFRPQSEMDALVERDARQFLKSLEEAIGPFLRNGKDDTTPIKEFREPVGAIARQFSNDLAFEDVAAELGHDQPESLRVLFRDPAYRRFGLAPLLDGKVIKRETWEKIDPYSTYQEVADRLGLGTPERVFE